MRIRILRRPSMASIDGLKLDRFERGFLYDVGTTVGILMLAQGWAKRVVDERPALWVPLTETPSPVVQPEPQPLNADTVPPLTTTPSNFIREFPSTYSDRLDIAADFARRKRRRRR